MQQSTQPHLSLPQAMAIGGGLAAVISFFALPWYSKASQNVSLGWMGSYQEPGIKITGYELSQLHGVLWLIPIGVALVIALLFVAPRIGVQASRVASLICGIVPFVIYISIAGQDIKQPGIGLIIGVIGTALAIIGVFKTQADTSGEASDQAGNCTSAEFDPSQLTKLCPKCKETIKLEATTCRFCHREFSEQEVNDKLQKQQAEFDAERKARRLEERLKRF